MADVTDVGKQDVLTAEETLAETAATIEKLRPFAVEKAALDKGKQGV